MKAGKDEIVFQNRAKAYLLNEEYERCEDDCVQVLEMNPEN